MCFVNTHSYTTHLQKTHLHFLKDRSQWYKTLNNSNGYFKTEEEKKKALLLELYSVMSSLNFSYSFWASLLM